MLFDDEDRHDRSSRLRIRDIKPNEDMSELINTLNIEHEILIKNHKMRLLNRYFDLYNELHDLMDSITI